MKAVDYWLIYKVGFEEVHKGDDRPSPSVPDTPGY